MKHTPWKAELAADGFTWQITTPWPLNEHPIKIELIANNLDRQKAELIVAQHNAFHGTGLEPDKIPVGLVARMLNLVRAAKNMPSAEHPDVYLAGLAEEARALLAELSHD